MRRAQVGDFIHVPALMPHMEINPSDAEPFQWVVVSLGGRAERRDADRGEPSGRYVAIGKSWEQP
jgi:uncharacterized RmlC-like cupin family protein